MFNQMAFDMAKRYADINNTHNLDERGAKIILNWVMSSIESYYWGDGQRAAFEANLYAGENKMVLEIVSGKGNVYEYVHYPTYNTIYHLDKMINIFANSFEDIKDPVSEKRPSVSFRAYLFEKRESGKYKGCYRVMLLVDMLPRGGADLANRERHG